MSNMNFTNRDKGSKTKMIYPAYSAPGLIRGLRMIVMPKQSTESFAALPSAPVLSMESLVFINFGTKYREEIRSNLGGMSVTEERQRAVTETALSPLHNAQRGH